METKYLSIITNFGCHYQCPYCIVKTNGIRVPKTTVQSLDKLSDCIKSLKATIISVSGGGDPLHCYPQHRDYYVKLSNICSDLEIPIEMHTSYIDSQFPYEMCYRVVYHLNHTNQLSMIKRHGNEKIRAVFVVTENMSQEEVEWIAGYVDRSSVIDELSFRQMVDDQYRATDYLKDFMQYGHSKGWWHYIEQNDYNTYFVEGKLYDRFADIH